jgi:ABC-type microcin C transport system permease subunit YejB
MSFAGKNLTQGGQMTAYRWRMFIQVNNWMVWIFILFAVLTTAIFSGEFHRKPLITAPCGGLPASTAVLSI